MGCWLKLMETIWLMSNWVRTKAQDEIARCARRSVESGVASRSRPSGRM